MISHTSTRRIIKRIVKEQESLNKIEIRTRIIPSESRESCVSLQMEGKTHFFMSSAIR